MDKIVAVFLLLGLCGCSANNSICEEITVTKDQIQKCQALQRQIVQNKQRPLIRTELERRYEQDCINVRFYRDDQQAKVCDSNKKIVPSANAVSRDK